MKPRLGLIIILALLAGCAWLAWGYPPAKLTIPPSDIIFTHSFHIDFECIQCHAEIESSSLAQDKNFPTMGACGDCHDLEDFEACGICHRNTEEPGASPNPERSILFSHSKHIANQMACFSCHGDMSQDETSPENLMPKMAFCFECHDGVKADERCAVCHGQELTLLDIHPSDWNRSHGEGAVVDRQWCSGCHRQESFCIDCHRGDNLDGNIHDLNYIYTHGLDAKSREKDCTRCHDTKTFCNSCHEQEIRMSLVHSSMNWRTDHGKAARKDLENCASCHDSSDPSCARGGCHADFDGLRGTDHRIHPAGISQFDAKGPWHDDDGYFCYQCHQNTRLSGSGFCGYCHR
jgi:hypothetical protein